MLCLISQMHYLQEPSPASDDQIEKHLEATKAVRKSASAKNQKSADSMVATHLSKHPLSVYAIGEEVLLRNKAKDRRVKRGGKKLTSATVLQGTVLEYDSKHLRYKINVSGTPGWYHVEDVTCLTREEELHKKGKPGNHGNKQIF